jgi:site-specific recombinase XerD
MPLEAHQMPVTAANVPIWCDVVATFLSAAIDSASTRRAYGRHLKQAGDLFGVNHVHELRGADLADYRAAVVATGLAPASQGQALSALRSFLAWTGGMGGHRLPAEVIARALRTPRASVRARFSVVNEREITALLKAAPGPRERAILAVLLGGGLRVAEAAHLHVSDIVEDLDGGVALFVRQGKNRKDRVVPVGPEVDQLLREYLVATKRYLGGEGPIFLAVDRGVRSRKDAGLSTRAIARMVVKVALSAGIAAKHVSPHALRHSYAVRCLRSGGNVVAVARLLGHANIATTQRYVDHLAVSELRATVPRLPIEPAA